MHNTLSSICCVGGLPYTTHFQIYKMYVLLEVVDVVLEVYHMQHTYKHVLDVYHTQRTFKICCVHKITFYNRNVGCAYT